MKSNSTNTSIKESLVSIVIPTYNRSKELLRAIKSVLNQTYQNFEILVVDDGSEEDIKKVCDSFNDQRIHFFRNEEHTNANVARNKGIKEAKGEYIAMLDSDDEFMPQHLQRRIEKMNEWKCDGIFGSAYIDNDDFRTLKLSRPLNKNELMINYLLSDGFAPTPSHFYKAVTAKEVMWDETLLRHQDFDFSVRFSKRYDFRSDYHPSTIIYWAKTQRKNFYIDSCLRFIDQNKKDIKNYILVSYYKNLFRSILNSNYNENLIYISELKKRILEYINLISISDYFFLNTDADKNVLYKIKFMLSFFMRILLFSGTNLARKIN